MAGGLAIEILTKPERIFSAYLIASPTHINTSRLDSLRERLITKKDVNEFIYFEALFSTVHGDKRTYIVTQDDIDSYGDADGEIHDNLDDFNP